jgi:hypothetical protein
MDGATRPMAASNTDKKIGASQMRLPATRWPATRRRLSGKTYWQFQVVACAQAAYGLSPP